MGQLYFIYSNYKSCSIGLKVIFQLRMDLSSMEIRGHGTRIADICCKFLVRDRGLDRLCLFVVGSPGKDRQDLERTYDRQRKC